MRERMKLANKLKTNKGITLIALVITVIVLLILAGVSISAITGNESAMEKAKQARTENEAGGELDAIKLAVVSAMSKGTYGMVEGPNLANELTGLVSSTTGIAENSAGPWEVNAAKSGRKYKIYSNGTVEEVSGAHIEGSSIVTFTDEDTTSKSLKVVAESGTISGITPGTVSNKALSVTADGTNIVVKLLTLAESGETQANYDAALEELAKTGVALTATATNNGKPYTVNFTVKYQDTVLTYINVKTESLALETTGTTNTGTIEIEGLGTHKGIVPLTGNTKKIRFKSGDSSKVKVSADGTNFAESVEVTEATSITVKGEGATTSAIGITVTFNGDSTKAIYPNNNTNVSVTVKKPSAFGTPQHQELYGEDVTYTSYNGTADWQLFYQNATHTYLITKALKTNVAPKQGSYTSASFSVSTNMAKRLNPLLVTNMSGLFSATTLQDNMIALAYECDTDVWKGYTPNNTTSNWTAENPEGTNPYAVIAPSVELFIASFNADTRDTDRNNVTLSEASTGSYGYNVPSGTLSTAYNKGIYNKGSGTYWWLASPYYYDGSNGLYVSGNSSYVRYNLVSFSFASRPLVCIPNSMFNYDSTTGAMSVTVPSGT